jgi:hypothetical protein
MDPMPPAHAAVSPTAIARPADRVHFLDEQRRLLRQTWRFTVWLVARPRWQACRSPVVVPFPFFPTVQIARRVQGRCLRPAGARACLVDSLLPDAAAAAIFVP